MKFSDLRRFASTPTYGTKTAYPPYVMYRKIFVKKKPSGVLQGILDGGVPPGSPNYDPISDHKMSLFTPVFRPGL